MKLIFGLALDNPSWPLPNHSNGGCLWLGPNGLLQWLEFFYGLAGHKNNNEYLRIEQYRQAIRVFLQHTPSAFFSRSFHVDQFATAANLLERRDELLLAGWDFLPASDAPERLRCIAAIEQILTASEQVWPEGFADRFLTLEQKINLRSSPLQQIGFVEPITLIPLHWKRLFEKLKQQGVDCVHPMPHQAFADTDLGRFQSFLEGNTSPQELTNDGTLLLLRGKRDTDLGNYLAALLRKNPAFAPCFLIPDKSRILDEAFMQEGLPSLGIQPASLARPTLQALKLIPNFLWTPVDPYKIMEFVSLPLKPLETELANRIAQQMAQTPGILGESWQAMLGQYFSELDERAEKESGIDVREIRQQYRFWFERRRFDISGSVPKAEVEDIFQYLYIWATKTLEQKSNNPSLLTLAEQAKQVVDLLQTLPEKELTRLELERIVRTVYEPAPMQMSLQEVGRFPYIHQSNALTAPVRDLIWWNFTQNEPDYFFSRWYDHERDWLNTLGIQLSSPATQNALLGFQRRHPIWMTQHRLILVIPETTEGETMLPHPLLGDLEACFGNLDKISATEENQQLSRYFEVPQKVKIPFRQLGKPSPFLQLKNPEKLVERAEETFTSLESLLYYPYQWLFRHHIRLRKSSILSIVKDSTLQGNLAHRFFQNLLLIPELRTWSKGEVDRWIDREAERLLHREGAVLLMYGKEAERKRFLKRLKFAAWSLVNLLQSNEWSVQATELPLEGDFANIKLNARADLVLARETDQAILDFKWRGGLRRELMIKNEEDLQLALYAHLLSDGEAKIHTAYFIMENGRLLARDRSAFKDIIPVSPDLDPIEVRQRILQKIQATLQWRLAQVKRGEVEIRCSPTLSVLERHYEQLDLLSFLEMKTEDAPFDDYRTLISLVV
jgi:ATP-dependent helicase/nuclease subunit B